MSVSHSVSRHEKGVDRPSGLNWSGVSALFAVTVRRLLGGKRLLGIGLLFLLPALLTTLIRFQGGRDEPMAIEFAMLILLIPLSALPFTALLLTSGLIQDEVEEQTLTYLLLRPLPRWLIYLTKLAAAIVCTIVIATLCTAINLAVIHYEDLKEPTELIQHGFWLSLIYALALFAYCGVFGLVGLLFRKSLPMGVIYIIFIEGLLANIPFVVRKATIIFYERVLMLRWLDLGKKAADTWSIDLELAPSSAECVLTLLGIGLAFGIVAGILFTVREFRVKTPEAT